MTNPSRGTIAGRTFRDLQNQARRDRRPFDELLTLYTLEGFLDSLAGSPHVTNLVLKGRLLLAATTGAGQQKTRTSPPGCLLTRCPLPPVPLPARRRTSSSRRAHHGCGPPPSRPCPTCRRPRGIRRCARRSGQVGRMATQAAARQPAARAIRRGTRASPRLRGPCHHGRRWRRRLAPAGPRLDRSMMPVAGFCARPCRLRLGSQRGDQWSGFERLWVDGPGRDLDLRQCPSVHLTGRPQALSGSLGSGSSPERRPPYTARPTASGTGITGLASKS